MRLSFFQGKKLLVVHPEQIIRLEADSNYTWIYFTDHPPILMAKVLRSYVEQLKPYGFLRTHRSHLVNMQYVTELDQNEILMSDASNAEISRSKKKEVYKSIALQRISF